MFDPKKAATKMVKSLGVPDTEIEYISEYLGLAYRKGRLDAIEERVNKLKVVVGK